MQEKKKKRREKWRLAVTHSSVLHLTSIIVWFETRGSCKDRKDDRSPSFSPSLPLPFYRSCAQQHHSFPTRQYITLWWKFAFPLFFLRLSSVPEEATKCHLGDSLRAELMRREKKVHPSPVKHFLFTLFLCPGGSYLNCLCVKCVWRFKVCRLLWT